VERRRWGNGITRHPVSQTTFLETQLKDNKMDTPEDRQKVADVFNFSVRKPMVLLKGVMTQG